MKEGKGGEGGDLDGFVVEAQAASINESRSCIGFFVFDLGIPALDLQALPVHKVEQSRHNEFGGQNHDVANCTLCS